ncbi:MAG TPA: DUF1501 domain-containing protein, partial [Planctomycetota bacterium]|nr:DUF1501 domain-containing protein [Planctomycetota bacterium]
MGKLPPRPSRRDALSMGLGGFVGWALRHGSLDSLFAQESRARGPARSCIVLWMDGGPSQIDTFDPKPGRASGGEFGAQKTAVPGMDISDRLPRLAGLAGSFSLIRSMHSAQIEHGPGSYLLRTGYEPEGATRHPSLGSRILRERAPEATVPGYVRIHAASGGSVPSEEGAGPGLLGHAYQPVEIDDPLIPRQGFPPLDAETSRRLDLAQDLDRTFGLEHRSAPVLDRTAQRSRIGSLKESGFLGALSLDGETEETRRSYGAGLPGRDGAFGSGCLLARRLVERGTTFVEVSLGGWDTHVDNFKSLEPLLGTLDLGFSGLLGDLRCRGLLSSTLVVWMGEFGRTPLINRQKGRDHYGQAFTVALAGGGIAGGRVVGKTDPEGFEIVQDPVTVPDLFATILRAMGSDPGRKEL